MASLDVLTTKGFLFPRNAAARNALSSGCIDETHHVDELAVPQLLQVSIRTAFVSSRMTPTRATEWPKGELLVPLVQEFIQILREAQDSEAILKSHSELTNKLVTWLERSVLENSAVWLNF